MSIFFFIFIAVMEVAIGEHDIDLTKMMGTALKKYYEERDAHSIGLVAADNIIRHADDGMPFFDFVFVFYCLFRSNVVFRAYRTDATVR